MLKRYFELRLDEFGFCPDELEVHWSISHCQSDYVAFSGRLSIETIQRLMLKKHGRIFDPKKDFVDQCPDNLFQMLRVLEDFGECDLALVAIGRMPTIEVQSTVDFEYIFDTYYQTMIAFYNDTVKFEDNRVWHKDWQDFLLWLLNEARALANDMQKKAADISLATNVEESIRRQYTTQGFIVNVAHESYDDSDFGVGYGDLDLATFQNLISGKCIAVSISAQVLDRQSNRLLGESCTYEYLGNSDRSDFAHLERAAAAEAIDDARTLLARHQLVA